MIQRPDTISALKGLKDFQRNTVDYVFQRFHGTDPTRRFLVADEVGLGKTLVARGVIARTIDHLWDELTHDETRRIDVIYICSNADIARQNIDRIKIPGCDETTQATRLTLLPLQMQDFRRINFVALTPGTSFEQTGGGGRIDERVLLYWLLDRAWGIHGSRASLYVMRDYAGVAPFEQALEAFDFEKLNDQIADRFVSTLAKHVEEKIAAGKLDLRTHFEELRGIFSRSNSVPPPGATKRRTRWIGELRRLLAQVCIATLKPDLIILDEFQRFKRLLDEDSDAGDLARGLFDSEAGEGARVLLLSATPYRGLSLFHEADDRGMWRLLWMPPALGYYALEGPFAAPELQGVTKRLVFSAWHMVPRAVASLLSYEAERQMMRAATPRGPLTQDDWRKQRGLLRFGISDDRLTGLPLLLLVYPCLTFGRDCDPRALARNANLTAADVRAQFITRIDSALEKLEIAREATTGTDDRWYWLAPMLLDFSEFPDAAREWWDRADLAQTWAGTEMGEEDAGWSSHVEHAKKTLDSIRNGKDRLGTPPDDLASVLALAASAAPATAAMRAYARASRTEPAACLPLRDVAARSGRAFLTLFNHAEVIEAVRTEFSGEPYWERVLEYAHAGGLQAVLDEYTHVLRESLSVAALSPDKIAEKLGAELIAALTIRAASLRIDDVTAPRYAREINVKPEPMRIRFAMRFGDDRSDEEPLLVSDGASPATRKERVRGAFNSPFWPFVLVSTSVGQEGLDFHHYCHAITHWNLPSNPVDLEQREGRIHRYKGHAVRKNVAAAFGADALRGEGADVWETVFDLGRKGRSQLENDLVPYWLFPGDAKIERHVPALPFSREVERLSGLRRALAIYRMVFGQSRQEDLITFLLAQIPESERDTIVAELQINLSPDASK